MAGHGVVRLDPIVVSRFALDGGGMFGVVPRTLWERCFPPDSRNRIGLVTRVLVARFPTEGRVVVIDSGIGASWNATEADRLGIDPGAPGLVAGLAEIGLAPDDVTDAVITHLHFDHAGGWTVLDGEGRVVPVLRRAIHHVQEEHWRWALSPSVRDRASFVARSFEPLARAGLVRFHRGSRDLFPGLGVEVLHGHTPAMQAVVVRGASGSVVFPSDLLPTAVHVPAAWGMAHDLRPLDLVEEKRGFLARAVAERQVIVLEHDPRYEAVKAVMGEGSFSVEPIECPREI